MESIQEFGDRIAAEYRPLRVVLFGSYAGGSAGPESDVDLLVIMPFEGHPARKSVEMRLRLRPAFPLDLLIRTPEYIQQRIGLGDPFVKGLPEHGQVLPEAPDR